MKLRFSIRDLLWLTLVVGLVLGWWLHQRKLSAKLNAETRKLLEHVATSDAQIYLLVDNLKRRTAENERMKARIKELKSGASNTVPK